jgi:hydroxymethylpyrimidine pyrophosphatase-like HAD family hydrolase
MFFHSYKGIIALDIDGTITSEAHFIHPDVVAYLASLHEDGWKLMFITGRPFQWGFQVLKFLSFPYLFAVQNGALVLEMPSQKIIDKRCLTTDTLPLFEKICFEEKTDFVVYSGFDHQDWCYYRPTHLSKDLLAYLQKRVATLGEKWQSVPSFKSLPISTFTSLKCFAKEDQAQHLSQRIEKELKLHAPPNRDPFNPTYFVIQATHPEATKGFALVHVRRSFAQPGITIAAGDDYNDITMLKEATIRVVMATAPSDLQNLAEVIAPPASKNGIIQGLTQAIKLANSYKGISHG